MARARNQPKKTLYVLPVERSASPNEQMFSIAAPPEDGRTTMLATPGEPFSADALGLSDEAFEQMVAENGLPFVAVEGEKKDEPEEADDVKEAEA